MQVIRSRVALGRASVQVVGERELAAKAGTRSAGQAGESGFSLIELLIVVIIIGVLASIAIPTYLSQREQAQAAAVQSDLRNAATAAVSCAADNGGSYTTCTLAVLDANYDFNPTSSVTIPAAHVVATATRWAADANYSSNPANTQFHFDTDDGSQVKPGNL